MKLERKVVLPVVLAIALGAALAGGVAAWKLRPPAGPLGGQWRNLDPQNAVVTRVVIGSGWSSLRIRVWGRCKPEDCDWGIPVSTDERSAPRGSLSAVWDDGATRHTQQFSLLPDGRLRVVTYTRLVDRSGRQDSEKIEYFGRASK